MGTEQTKDSVKDIERRNISESISNEPGTEQVVKKRLPKRIRQIPDSYFLPRRSLPYAIAFYGAWIVVGVRSGMLAEVWINKKIKEDGSVVIWFQSELLVSWPCNISDASCMPCILLLQMCLGIGSPSYFILIYSATEKLAKT